MTSIVTCMMVKVVIGVVIRVEFGFLVVNIVGDVVGVGNVVWCVVIYQLIIVSIRPCR